MFPSEMSLHLKPTVERNPSGDRLADISRAVQQAAASLPANGSLRYFRHHNPLSGLEHLPFFEAAGRAGRLFRAETFLTEERYRQMLADGDFDLDDVAQCLFDDLSFTAYDDVAGLTDRLQFRQAVMQLIAAAPHHSQPNLNQFHPAVAPVDRTLLLRNQQSAEEFLARLWNVCRDNLTPSDTVEPKPASAVPTLRRRDQLLKAGGIDADELVHALLVPFLAAFLDQGQASWLPADRELGLLKVFAELYATTVPAQPPWLKLLPLELEQLNRGQWDPLASIDESLALLGIPATDEVEFLRATLFVLPGWAGIVKYLETDADWMPWPVPDGTLQEFVALRLILDRLAADYVASVGEPSDVSATAAANADVETDEVRVATTLFDVAQVMGWTPERLSDLTPNQWLELQAEVRAFPETARRRCFQSAFEAACRSHLLDAVAAHARTSQLTRDDAEPSIQIILCADPALESLRRHLEEADANCRTYGTPGFFGLAMNFRGLDEHYFAPQCPPHFRARHYVQEIPSCGSTGTSHPRFLTRPHQPGQSQFPATGASSPLESWLSQSWTTNLLLPRKVKQWLRQHTSLPRQPQSRQLDCEDIPDQNRLPGYTLDEMAETVRHLLHNIGLTSQFAPIVLVVGHVSHSVNNPFSAADTCAFCSGRSSGPNARTFAMMANDPRVRTRLAQDGLMIPAGTVFVAAEHDTCGDTVEYYDLPRLSLVQRQSLPAALDLLGDALHRNAEERCRRFDHRPLEVSRDAAVDWVDDRAVDLTELCPEHSYTGNAVCIIGRRSLTRGLFLDRRAFLVSYDPAVDDDEGSRLHQVLKEVIPTCLSVNLQYYFSCIDPERFGAGSKLHHTVVSGMGVSDQPDGDLKTGLPEQMVRLHEPRRLTCVVESTPQILKALLNENSLLKRWCDHQWLYLATFDPQTQTIDWWHRGDFRTYKPQRTEFPEVTSSKAWYHGLQHNLNIAGIKTAGRYDL